MEVGDKIRLMATGGTIPGITPGDYFVVAKDLSGRIAIAATADGNPLVPTGPTVGQPIFYRLADFEYAYPLQDNAWLRLSLEEYFNLSLTQYLSLELM